MRQLLLVAMLIVLASAGQPLLLGLSLDSRPPTLIFPDVVSSTVGMALALKAEPSFPASLTLLNQPLTGGLGTNVQVTFDPSFLPQNEPSVSVNPASPLNLVAGANDYRLVALGHQAWAGVYTSTNGGLTWSNQLIPGYPGGPTTTVLSSFAVAGDPGVTFDKNGNAYYSGLAFNIQGISAVDGSVFLSKSTNGGLSFTQTLIVAFGSTKVFNDKPYVGVDRTNSTFSGSVYVSWTRFTSFSADILVSSSSNGGLSFSTPVKVSTSTVNQGSVPVVGPSGELYIVWNDISNSRIEVAKSTNGGSSFSSPTVVSNYVRLPSPLPNSKFRVNSNPGAAVDDVNGNVYVAWADYRNGNADIMFSRSTNGGLGWSAPFKLNDDNTTNDHFFPWMTVSKGRLSADWYDRRLDPANHLMDVFYTQSTDGGSTFTSNVRITDVSSNPDAVLFSSGQSFIGDYIGIASNATVVHPVWTDLRNVTPTTPADQDIFTDNTLSHDLAVRALAPARNAVYQGVSVRPLNVTALVENLGLLTENSLTVSFSANGTLIGSLAITTLAARSMVNTTLNWDTNTLAKGTYILSSSVSPVPGETNLANNNLISGSVQVRFPGDVDGDKVVNIIDLSIVALAFNSSPGSPNWNVNADITNDNVVNIVDFSITALNYGKIDP